MRVRLSSLLLVAGVVLTGCSRTDPRLKNLQVGMPRDSVYQVLGISTPERQATYLIAGQYIESMMLRREGLEGPLDSLPRDQITPIVTIDGKLTGWGWSYWDSVARAHNIQQ